MKRVNKILGAMVYTTGFLFISLIGNAQESKPGRLERKELRKAELTANYNILDSLLKAKSFVLEADYLGNQWSGMIPVPANVNFISVDATKGVLQTGYYNGVGYNGVGGITTEGSIQSWKVYNNSKNLSHTLQFTLGTKLGFYDISMTISADNNVWASITGLTPGRLTYQGHLATLDNSRVFKGHEAI